MTSPTPTDAERLKSQVAAIACMAIFGITVAAFSPLISLILESRGYDRTTIGAMAAAPALTLLLTNPFIPAVVKRMGLKPFLWACIALQLLLVLAMPILDHIAFWFVLRCLMGAAVNGLFVASETWINAVAKESSRGRVLAVYGTVLSGSFALGPVLVSSVGIEGWAPFLAISVLIILAALPLLWVGAVELSFAGKTSFSVISFLWLAPTLSAVVFLGSFKEMTMASLMPLFGLQSGLAQSDAVTLLTAGYLGSLFLQLPVGWLADRMDRYLLLIILTTIGLTGTLALPIVMTFPLPLVWLVLALWVGLFAGTYIVAMTIVGQRFRGADLVTANAAFGLLWGLGSLIGPLSTGAAMDQWQGDGFIGTIAAVTIFALAIAIWRQFTRPKI